MVLISIIALVVVGLVLLAQAKTMTPEQSRQIKAILDDRDYHEGTD